MFIKYRNESMRKNYLEAIAERDPQSALALQNATFQQLQAYVTNFNDNLQNGMHPGMMGMMNGQFG